MRTQLLLVAILCLIAIVGAQECNFSAQNPSSGCDWSYDSSSVYGPNCWGLMCSGEWEVCGVGAEQSPINFGASFDYDEDRWGLLEGLRYINWGTYTNVEFRHTGHSLVATVPLLDEEGRPAKRAEIAGGRINGAEYRLLRYEMRTLSEHTFDGEHTDLEVQYLAQRVLPGDHRGMEYLMVSVFYKIDRENEEINAGQREAYFLNNAWQSLIFDEGLLMEEGAQVVDFHDFGESVPLGESYYTYDGSFTDPSTGCAETVEWYVIKDPQYMSRDQWIAVNDRIGYNNRPVQETGSRTVWLYQPSAASAIQTISMLVLFVLAVVMQFF